MEEEIQTEQKELKKSSIIFKDFKPIYT